MNLLISSEGNRYSIGRTAWLHVLCVCVCVCVCACAHMCVCVYVCVVCERVRVCVCQHIRTLVPTSMYCLWELIFPLHHTTIQSQTTGVRILFNTEKGGREHRCKDFVQHREGREGAQV